MVLGGGFHPPHHNHTAGWSRQFKSFTKTKKKTKKTYTGFLNVSGPRVIRSIDLKLPAGLECVDPNQYIATLAEDGLLNMKFTINEGKNFIKQKPHNLDSLVLKKQAILRGNLKKNFLNDITFIPQSQRSHIYKGTSISSKISNIIPLDAVFMPVTKINCIIEENNLYTDFNNDSIRFLDQTKSGTSLFDSPNLMNYNNKFQSFLNKVNLKSIYGLQPVLQKNSDSLGSSFNLTSGVLSLSSQRLRLSFISQDQKPHKNMPKRFHNGFKWGVEPMNNYNTVQHLKVLLHGFVGGENPPKTILEKSIEFYGKDEKIFYLHNRWLLLTSPQIAKLNYYKKLRGKQRQFALSKLWLDNDENKRERSMHGAKYLQDQKKFKVIPYRANSLFFNLNDPENNIKTFLGSLWLAYPADMLAKPSFKKTFLLSQTQRAKTFFLKKDKIKAEALILKLPFTSLLANPTSTILPLVQAQTNFDLEQQSVDKIKPLKTFLKNKAYNLFKINPLKDKTSKNNQYLEYNKILQLKPLRKKNHLIVEIWTNGSLHPRQALYQSFMFLSNNFLKLQTVKSFGSMFKSVLAYGNLKYSISKNYHLSKNKNQSFSRGFSPFSKGETRNKGKRYALLFTPSSFSSALAPQLPNITTNVVNVNTSKKGNLGVKKVEDIAIVPHRVIKYNDFSKIEDPAWFWGGFTPPHNHTAVRASLGEGTGRWASAHRKQMHNKRTFYLKTSLKAPIGILKISLRAYTALKKAGIFTLNDLILYSKKDLLKIKNIGTKSLSEIEINLSDLGLTLK